MNKNIFEFKSYIAYFRHRLEAPGQRGAKAKMAAMMNIKPTYISQVLQEKAHFSLEQIEAANLFFQHTSDESHFLILLAQKERAGTRSLKNYFQNQIQKILDSRMILTERLGTETEIKDEDKSWYYSTWLPAAIHIATTIPHLRTVAQMARAFQVSENVIVKIIERLEQMGLVSHVGQEYHPGQRHIRLGNQTHYIIKHHTNWRLQALQSLDRERPTDLHYSAVVSLSEADVVKVKDFLLETIKSSLGIVKESKEEVLYNICLDFYDLLAKK